MRTEIRFHLTDDDADDRLLIEEAFADAGITAPVDFSTNGQELMDYLSSQDADNRSHERPLPDVLLLDLNMPRKNGHQCIQEIRSNKELAHLPIVVLSTSAAEHDVLNAYRLGANSYFKKPANYSELVQLVKCLADYWLDFAVLPQTDRMS